MLREKLGWDIHQENGHLQNNLSGTIFYSIISQPLNILCLHDNECMQPI